MKRGTKTKAGIKRKRSKNKQVKRFMEDREDLQLAGRIATEPGGAVRNEVVDPATQDEQRFPDLDRMAIRNERQWGITEKVMRKIVEINAEVIYERKTYFDKDGNERELPPDRAAQVQASRVLMAADERDWDRKHPEEAGKIKGGVKVAVENNVAVISHEQLYDKIKSEVLVDEIEDAINNAAPRIIDGSGDDQEPATAEADDAVQDALAARQALPGAEAGAGVGGDQP